MLPVLLDLKFVKIYTFGIFLVLAFFWGCFLLWKNIRLTSFKEEDIFDGLFLALGGGLFLGRLVYVILNFNKFGFNVLKFILINGYPGLSLFGGLAGGLIVLHFFLLSKKSKVVEVLDYFISPLFLALAFGKLGSFFSGAEVGTKTKFFLAIRYTGFDGLRHLTPLYEACLFFLGAYLAQQILFQIRREKYSQGTAFNFFIWYFSLVYFVFDRIRSDRLYFMKQSFNEMVAGFLLLTLSFYFLYYFRSSVIVAITGVVSYLKSYGNKTFTKIYRAAKQNIARRKGKNSASDQRSKGK